MRLEGWAAPWFEMRSFGALLIMRPIDAAEYESSKILFP